jgi:hypothetical protein
LEKGSVECEYLSDKGSCNALKKNEEGEAVRDESCMNDVKDSCCYMCPEREKCEISCDYLSTENKQEAVRTSPTASMDNEIAKYKNSIEKLSVFFAEGKISEESYLGSVRSLEDRINRLRELKKNPESLDSQQHPSRFNEDEYYSVEKPSSAWYLVPFLFGLIGGIIGYVGTKDRDEDMAWGLLVFGIVCSFFWGFIFLILLFR